MAVTTSAGLLVDAGVNFCEMECAVFPGIACPILIALVGVWLVSQSLMSLIHPCFTTGQGKFIDSNMPSSTREVALKALWQVKAICSHLRSQGSEFSIDLNSSDIDIHINHVGPKVEHMGLATAAGLLALVMGQGVDPRACFVGVSIILIDTWLRGLI